MNKPALAHFTATVTAVATVIAIGAPTSLAAMEKEQQFAPLVLGPTTAEQSIGHLGARFELLNKHVDQSGIVLNNDVTARASASARIWGLGAQVDGYFVIAPDTRPARVDTKFGECTELDLKIDYLIEIPFTVGVPLVQLNPFAQLITYPDQDSNDLKDHQQWLGLDAWVSPPFQGFEGIEFGGGFAYNIGTDLPLFRASGGSRQFFQFAPYDIALFQLVNVGNAHYHQAFVGTVDNRGETTVEVGAKITSPLAYRDWWTFVRFEVLYWLDTEDRDAIKATGRNSAEVLLGIGLEWRADSD